MYSIIPTKSMLSNLANSQIHCEPLLSHIIPRNNIYLALLYLYYSMSNFVCLCVLCAYSGDVVRVWTPLTMCIWRFYRNIPSGDEEGNFNGYLMFGVCSVYESKRPAQQWIHLNIHVMCVMYYMDSAWAIKIKFDIKRKTEIN